MKKRFISLVGLFSLGTLFGSTIVNAQTLLPSFVEVSDRLQTFELNLTEPTTVYGITDASSAYSCDNGTTWYQARQVTTDEANIPNGVAKTHTDSYGESLRNQNLWLYECTYTSERGTQYIKVNSDRQYGRAKLLEKSPLVTDTTNKGLGHPSVVKITHIPKHVRLNHTFKNYPNLESINFSNRDKNATTIYKAFENNPKLRFLPGSEGLDIGNNASGAFKNTPLFNDPIISTWTSSYSTVNLEEMFLGTTSMTQELSNSLISKSTNFIGMFENATSFPSNIEDWDVSKGTWFHRMFKNSTFNRSLVNWDTSNATVMQEMFRDNKEFNSPLFSNVSNVNNFTYMFAGTDKFNQSLRDWNTESATSLAGMFMNAKVFNQPIGHFKTSKVTNLENTFFNADSFNQDLSGWNTQLVTNMGGTFGNTRDFNQDLSSWNTGKVQRMTSMFSGTESFNQDLSTWDVTSVKDATSIFFLSKAFNSSSPNFSSSQITKLDRIFAQAERYNLDLKKIPLSQITSGDSYISKDKSITVENYLDLLRYIKSERDKGVQLQRDVLLSTGPKYCSSLTEITEIKNDLKTSHNWTILDGGPEDCGRNIVFENNSVTPSENYFASTFYYNESATNNTKVNFKTDNDFFLEYKIVDQANQCVVSNLTDTSFSKVTFGTNGNVVITNNKSDVGKFFCTRLRQRITPGVDVGALVKEVRTQEIFPFNDLNITGVLKAIDSDTNSILLSTSPDYIFEVEQEIVDRHKDDLRNFLEEKRYTYEKQLDITLPSGYKNAKVFFTNTLRECTSSTLSYLDPSLKSLINLNTNSYRVTLDSEDYNNKIACIVTEDNNYNLTFKKGFEISPTYLLEDDEEPSILIKRLVVTDDLLDRLKRGLKKFTWVAPSDEVVDNTGIKTGKKTSYSYVQWDDKYKIDPSLSFNIENEFKGGFGYFLFADNCSNLTRLDYKNKTHSIITTAENTRGKKVCFGITSYTGQFFTFDLGQTVTENEVNLIGPQFNSRGQQFISSYAVGDIVNEQGKGSTLRVSDNTAGDVVENFMENPKKKITLNGKEVQSDGIQNIQVGEYTFTYSLTDPWNNPSQTITYTVLVVENDKTLLREAITKANEAVNDRPEKIYEGLGETLLEVLKATDVLNNKNATKQQITEAITQLDLARESIKRDTEAPSITLPPDLSFFIGEVPSYDLYTRVTFSDNVTNTTTLKESSTITGSESANGQTYRSGNSTPSFPSTGVYKYTFNTHDEKNNNAEQKTLTITIKPNDKTELVNKLKQVNNELANNPSQIYSGKNELEAVIPGYTTLSTSPEATKQQIRDAIADLDDKLSKLKRDSDIPVITTPNNSTHKVGSITSYDLLDSVTVTDVTDKTLTTNNLVITVNDQPVNGTTINSLPVGTYTIKYNVSDHVGNRAVEKTVVVTITGTDKSELERKLQEATTTINTDPTKIYEGKPELEKEIRDATNVKDNPNATEQQVADAIKKLTDAINGIKRDTEKPVITVPSNKSIIVGTETTYNAMSGVSVTDNRDTNLIPTIKLNNQALTNNTVNIGRVGTYTFTYNVTDSVGNIAEEKTFILTVVEANKDGLREAITKAKAEDLSKVYEGDQALKDAITSAETIRDNPDATADQITNEIKKLNDAIDNLKRDLNGPEISFNTNETDRVIISVTDPHLKTSSTVYYFKDTPDNKTRFTSGQRVDITRQDHGKILVAEGEDIFGNKTTEEITLNFSDINGPEITIDNTKTNKIKATITDSSDITKLVYVYKDSSTIETSYTSDTELTIIKELDGKTIVFIATDKHGNTSTKEEVLRYIDDVPPTIDITIPKKDTVVAIVSDGSYVTCQYWFKDNDSVKLIYTSGQEISLKREHHGKILVFSCLDDNNNKTETEFNILFSDISAPIITPNTDTKDVIKATITDDSPFTSTYHFKDTSDVKHPYISDSPISITRNDHGKVIVITATDEHGNTFDKEIPVVFSDTKNPVITIDSSKTNIVKADITDDNNTTNKVYFEDNLGNKEDYTSGTERTIRPEDHNKVLVFESTDIHGNTSTEKVTLIYVDNINPEITIDTSKKDIITAIISDTSSVTCQYWYKDNETEKFPYTSNTEIKVKRTDHGRILVISCVDNNNNKTEKEITLSFSDINNPIITTDTSKKDIVSASITDESPVTTTVRVKGDETNKKPYTSGQDINITREDHGKILVFIATDEHGNQTEKEVTLTFSDIDSPNITLDTSITDRLSATITDSSPTTTIRYYKDSPDNKVPYTSGTPIVISREDHGKVLVFESTDVHGNKTTTETTLGYSDITPPNVTFDTNTPDRVKVIVDNETGSITIKAYLKDNPDTEIPYDPNTGITVTRDMHGKTLVVEVTDEHGNKTIKEYILVYSDVEAPEIKIDNKEKNKHNIKAEDKSDWTLTTYNKNTPNNKTTHPVNTGTEIVVTKDRDGEVIVIEAIDSHGNKSVKELTLVYDDKEAPEINVDQTEKDTVKIIIEDQSDTTLEVMINGQSVAYNPTTGIKITRGMHGQPLLIKATDVNNNVSTKEVRLVFSDIDSPIIEINSTVKDQISATITDKSNIKSVYYYADTPNDKKPYISGQGITITRNDHNRRIIFESVDEHDNSSRKEHTLTYSDITGPTISGTYDNIKSEAKATITDVDSNVKVTYYIKGDETNKKSYTSGVVLSIPAQLKGKVLVFEAIDSHGNKSIYELLLLEKSSMTMGGIVDSGNKTDRNDNNKPEITITSKNGELTFGVTDKDNDIDKSTYIFDNGEEKRIANKSKIKVTLEMLNKTFEFKAIDLKKNEDNKKYTITENDLSDEDRAKLKKKEKVNIIVYKPEQGGSYSINSTQCKNYQFILGNNPINFFADTTNDKYGITIANFREAGIVDGVDGINFEPNRGITRAEFLAILLRANCIHTDFVQYPFTDVDPDHWSYDVIGKAYGLGWIKGYDNNTVKPNEQISKLEVLYVLLRLNGLKVELPENFDEVKYTDIVNDEMRVALNKAKYLNLIEGEKEVRFNPSMKLERKKIMMLLEELFGKYLGK